MPALGYVLEGRLIASYSDGREEETRTGELFYWPPGHTIRASEDSEIVMFSPQNEHSAVIEHILAKLGESE